MFALSDRASRTRAASRLPIGVFDSGIGGLTVLRQLHRVLPGEDLIYLGDTARVPYGTKSPETVIRFACEDSEFLLRQGVKAIVVACNTASAWALGELERLLPVPVFGVIVPGARAALSATTSRRIGVIGTSATIRSQAYTKCILARDDTAQIFARACPLLVPLVEEGWTNHAVTRAALRVYLKPLRMQKIDTLVLGCTHYPLLKPAIQEVVGKTVRLIDSAESCAAYVRERLAKLSLLQRQKQRQGGIQPFVTDELERFEELSTRFMGTPMAAPRKVALPTPTS